MTTQADADNFAQSETVKLLKEEVKELRERLVYVQGRSDEHVETIEELRLWVADLQAGQTCCTRCGWNYGQTDRPVVGAYKDCPLGPHRADDTDGTPA